MTSENIIEQETVNLAETGVETIPGLENISNETIVQVLVKKGVCTRYELLRLEQKLNSRKRHNSSERYNHTDQSEDDKSSTFINIDNPFDRGKFPALKKIMSNHRWSRKLGTRIFGWKWKKVKKNN